MESTSEARPSSTILRLPRFTWTVRAQLIAGLVGLLVSVAACFTLYFPSRQRALVMRDRVSRLEGTAEVLAMGVSIGLGSADLSVVSSAVRWAKGDTTLVYAGVFDDAGVSFGEFNIGRVELPLETWNKALAGPQRVGGLLVLTKRVQAAGRTVGSLRLAMSLAAAEREIASDQRTMWLILIVILLLASVVGYYTAYRIARPLVRLRGATERLAAGDWAIDLRQEGAEEVRALARSFGSMAHRTRQAMDDLTKQAEELAAARDAALAAARARSRFLATVSHEIRTPMSGVLGLLDLLLRTSLTPRQRTFLKGARESADGLMVIIDDILDFSKIESGRLQLEETEFDAGELVENVAMLLAERAHRKKLELVCDVDLPRGLPLRVLGDPTRIRQVLLNFGGNAVKFTAQGHVTLRLAAQANVAGRATLTFDVIDSGIGIKPDVLERLFQPFTQADVSTTRRFGGTGLGLSISKRLIEAMDGQLSVASEPGLGSRFSFTLTLPRLQAPLVLERPVGAGLYVLIADADEATRTIAARYARDAGAQVTECHDVASAVALAERRKEQERFDLILVDGRLQQAQPELVAALSQVAGRSPQRPDPVLVLHSLGLRDTPASDGDASEDTSLLLRPLRRSHLCQALRSAREGRPTSTSAAPTVADSPVVTERVRHHVLLAEDNAVNRMIAVELLGELGYRVTVAANGVEALRLLGSNEFDLILMDGQMPEMDGYEATRRIRALAEPLSRIPIIALTANAIQGDREDCLAAGMNDYLAKPYTRQQLQRALERWLRGVEPRSGSATSASPASPPSPVRAIAGAKRGAGEAAIPIDLSQLRALVANDEQKVARFLERFVANGTEVLQELREHERTGNRLEIRRLAHSLKGSSASVGATFVSGAAAALQEEAEFGSSERIDELLGVLAERMDDASRFVSG